MDGIRIVENVPATFGFRCSRRPALQLAFFAFLVLLFPAHLKATQKNVLILSGGRGRVSINEMEASLRAHFSEPVNFFIVDVDNPRSEQKSYRDNLAEGLRVAYAGQKLDVH